jgi:nucleoside transporter
MDTALYLQLSVMMFLQYALWGAWSPVLAARLLGPLKMSGKQTGWIYGTIWLGAIVAPLIAGQIVDRWIETQWFLAGAHLAGGILLLAAARQKTFWPLFIVMGLYALTFAPTIGLVNAVMFRHIPDAATQSFGILLWGPISWVLAGWALTAWRRIKGAGDGSDCLVMAGLLALVMGLYCLTLPSTPPAGKAGEALPFLKAFELCRDPGFAVFLLVAFIIGTQLQFYFLGTARFLGDLGVKETHVPAAMTIAQVAQVLIMVAMQYTGVVQRFGFTAILIAGLVCWMLMYFIYTLQKPPGLVVASQALHGLAYALFVMTAFVYVDHVAGRDFSASAQALLVVVLFGFGFFAGTQFTGIVMDRFRTAEKFRWGSIFMVPGVIILVCVVVFAVFVRA